MLHPTGRYERGSHLVLGPQAHRVIQARKGLRSPLVLKARLGLVRWSCAELYLVLSWKPQRRGTAQSLWAIPSTAWLPSRWNFSP